MKVLFVAGFGPIVSDARASHALYEQALRLPLEPVAPGDDYLHTGALEGVKHFGLWPLAQAAESCFGTSAWPREVPVPQGWIEFDVEDIQAATKHLQDQGYRLLVAAREEPWGQVVTRFLSPEGLLVGVTVTPWMRGPGQG